MGSENQQEESSRLPRRERRENEGGKKKTPFQASQAMSVNQTARKALRQNAGEMMF